MPAAKICPSFMKIGLRPAALSHHQYFGFRVPTAPVYGFTLPARLALAQPCAAADRPHTEARKSRGRATLISWATERRPPTEAAPLFYNSICSPALPGLPSVREDRRVQQDRQGQRGLLVQRVQQFRARHLFRPGRVVRAVPPDLQNIPQA